MAAETTSNAAGVASDAATHIAVDGLGTGDRFTPSIDAHLFLPMNDRPDVAVSHVGTAGRINSRTDDFILNIILSNLNIFFTNI